MTANPDLKDKFLCGPEIYSGETSDMFLCGPEIYESSSGEESEHADSEFEVDTNPYNVTFIVGGQERKKFSLNRFVIEISSPEFRRILLEQPKIRNCYELLDVVAEFQILVDYMFLKSSWTFKNVATALSLVETAGKFHLFGFQEEVFDQLRAIVRAKSKLLGKEVVFQAFSTCNKYDVRDGYIAEVARQNILRNAFKLLEGTEFLSLSSSDFAEILASDDLVVKFELQVLKAVIRWTVHSVKAERKLLTSEILWEVLAPLVKFIRFRYLAELEFRQYLLPLNIVPPEVAANLRTKNNDAKPRKYIKNDELYQTKTIGNAELETARAEKFVSNFQHDIKFYNEQMTMMKLYEKQLEEKVECLQRKNEVEKSNAKRKKKTLEALNRNLQVENKGIRLQAESAQTQHTFEVKSLEEIVQVLRTEQLEIKKRVLAERQFKLQRTLAFENTQKLAVALIVVNSTRTTLKLYRNYVKAYSLFYATDPFEYERIVQEILLKETEAFGVTSPVTFNGYFSYQVHDSLFLVRYEVNQSFGLVLNSISIALCPQNLANEDIFQRLESNKYWSGHEDRSFDMSQTSGDKELFVFVNLGKLHAMASMKTGLKATVKINIFEDVSI